MTGDVDLLAGNEVFSRNARADGKQSILGLDTEFRDLHLQLDARLGKGFALRLVDILLLGFARTDLDREVTIAIGSTVSGNLAIFQRKNGNRHVPTVLLEEAGHPDFLCDNASAHRKTPNTEAPRPIRGACQPIL